MEHAGRGGRLTDGAYLIRRAMSLALDAAFESLGKGLPDRAITLLDIGGRGRPHAALISRRLGGAGRDVRHVVIDPDPGADAAGMAETLPLRSACVEMVLCTQVLEHVADPQQAVSEMRRVLRPGGVCLLTTHGTWFYHPDPEDYWRWTSAGLARLFATCGFEEVDVRPVGGTKLAIATLGLTAIERGAGNGLAGALARRLLVAPANVLASRALMRRVSGRTSLPGELAINYLVTARRGRA